MAAEVSAQLDADGGSPRWTYDVWSQGHTARPGYAGRPGLLAAAHLARPARRAPGSRPGRGSPAAAPRATRCRSTTSGARRVTGHRVLRCPIRSSALRALGAHLNVFAIE